RPADVAAEWTRRSARFLAAGRLRLSQPALDAVLLHAFPAGREEGAQRLALREARVLAVRVLAVAGDGLTVLLAERAARIGGSVRCRGRRGQRIVAEATFDACRDDERGDETRADASAGASPRSLAHGPGA